MMPRMPSAADKKRWDDLHAAYAQASKVELAYEIELGAKYGHNFQSSWLSKGQKAKLEKLRAAKNKIGDKIIDLLVRVSPRGDTWLSGVPSWWIREKLTWEDAIRPANETLSVVVPGSYGSPDGYVKEQKVRTMPRGISKDLADFKETLEKGVILVGGEAVNNNSIDVDDDTPVSVAVVVNVTGYGPHVGVICAVQGHVDEALQEAYGILEEWEMDHNPDYFKELEKEYGDEASDMFTETFDGVMWELPAEDFVAAIKGTAAEKYIDVVEYEDEPSEMREGALGVSEPNDARDILEGLGPYMTHEGHDAARESARIARMIAGVRGNAERADKVLEEVDRLVSGNGVEPVRDENVNDNYYGDVVALYVNMGDTYETTLLYDTVEHEFHVTSWGDWYEAYEAEQEESEDDEEPEDEDYEEEETE